MTDEPIGEFDPDAPAQGGADRRRAAASTQAHDGTGRVDLGFTVEDLEAPSTHRKVRVPPGRDRLRLRVVERHRDRLHLRWPRHLPQVQGPARPRPTPATQHDVKTFSREQLDGGWRLACLAQATRDHEVVVPPLTTRPKAATVGVGRQVILRPAVQKRYVELTEPTLEDQRTDLDRLLAAIDDLEPVADLHLLRRLPAGAARGRLQGDRRGRRRGADRRRARRHHRRSGTRSPSTSAPRPWSPPCSTWSPARRSRSPRCSTSSSPSAGT